jgi:hypothetical protein
MTLFVLELQDGRQAVVRSAHAHVAKDMMIREDPEWSEAFVDVLTADGAEQVLVKPQGLIKKSYKRKKKEVEPEEIVVFAEE